jgi:hypothetical protein
MICFSHIKERFFIKEPSKINNILGFAGHNWPAGHMLCMPALNYTVCFADLGKLNLLMVVRF